MKKTVDAMMEEAFFPDRQRRSQEFMRGARDVLALVLDGMDSKLPYEIASAQANAYFAGRQEGIVIVDTMSL